MMDQYNGRKLNSTGRADFKDMIDSYGHISEQCSERHGVMIFFNRRNYSIKEIRPIRYTSSGCEYTDSLPEEAMEHLSAFIKYITVDAK